MTGDDCSGKVGKHFGGSGATEDGRRRGARQSSPLGIDADDHTAGKSRAPSGGCGLECNQALLAEGRAGVTTYRRDWCGIVEADIRRISIHNRDGGGGECLA